MASRIYVDDMYMEATVGRVSGRWCHLFAYPMDVDALCAFADSIGMSRSWIQGLGRARPFPHFDVVESRRRRAVARGAIQVSYRSDLPLFLNGSWPK